VAGRSSSTSLQDSHGMLQCSTVVLSEAQTDEPVFSVSREGSRSVKGKGFHIMHLTSHLYFMNATGVYD